MVLNFGTKRCVLHTGGYGKEAAGRSPTLGLRTGFCDDRFDKLLKPETSIKTWSGTPLLLAVLFSYRIHPRTCRTQVQDAPRTSALVFCCQVALKSQLCRTHGKDTPHTFCATNRCVLYTGGYGTYWEAVSSRLPCTTLRPVRLTICLQPVQGAHDTDVKQSSIEHSRVCCWKPIIL